MNRILSAEEYRETGAGTWQRHDSWELVYCTGGRGLFRLDSGRTLPCRKGALVAIPPEQGYAVTAQREITGIRLAVEEPSFPVAVAFRLGDDACGSLRAAFHQAMAYYDSGLKHGELILRALGELLAACITVLHSNRSFSGPVEEIRSAILQGYSRTDFSPDQVIRRMPFHYDYLRKRFKQEVGQSPLAFMTALRMEKAGALLADGKNGYAISQIARMCGYEDALYFSRVFKHHYGCTPTSFAKNPPEAL